MSIAVILTAWKRDYFDLQLSALQAQTIKPSRVLIWQNGNHIDTLKYRALYPFELVHARDTNFKYHGRFTLPLLLQDEYVAVFDDDCIPGRRWLENCLRCSREHKAIVGANGRTVDPATWRQDGSGAGQPVREDLEVDFVGHSWFFRREWASTMWSLPGPTLSTGEDIHLAAACKIRSGIRCFVPRQPEGKMEWYGDCQNHLGTDKHASYRNPEHIPTRQEAIRYWVGQGWRLQRARGGVSVARPRRRR